MPRSLSELFAMLAWMALSAALGGLGALGIRNYYAAKNCEDLGGVAVRKVKSFTGEAVCIRERTLIP